MKTTQDLNGYDAEKLLDFFKTVIGPKDMAKLIRRANYILALNSMNADDNAKIREYWVEDIFIISTN